MALTQAQFEEHDDEREHAERIKRAAAHISATELSDGNWAHYADETSTWWVVTDDELADLCDYLDHPDQRIRGDAYSHWCSGTESEEMPRGWEPGDEEADDADQD